MEAAELQCVSVNISHELLLISNKATATAQTKQGSVNGQAQYIPPAKSLSVLQSTLLKSLRSLRLTRNIVAHRLPCQLYSYARGILCVYVFPVDRFINQIMSDNTPHAHV